MDYTLEQPSPGGHLLQVLALFWRRTFAVVLLLLPRNEAELQQVGAALRFCLHSEGKLR